MNTECCRLMCKHRGRSHQSAYASSRRFTRCQHFTGMALLLVDGFADLDPDGQPAWAPALTPSSPSR